MPPPPTFALQPPPPPQSNNVAHLYCSVENEILFCIFFSEAKCPKEYGFMCMAGKHMQYINSTLGSPESDIKNLIDTMIIQIEWMGYYTFYHSWI